MGTGQGSAAIPPGRPRLKRLGCRSAVHKGRPMMKWLLMSVMAAVTRSLVLTVPATTMFLLPVLMMILLMMKVLPVVLMVGAAQVGGRYPALTATPLVVGKVRRVRQLGEGEII